MPEAASAFIEKRQFERIDARFQVRFEVIPDAETEQLMTSRTYADISVPPVSQAKVKDVMTVVTENVSVGGLMISGQAPFRSGQSIRLELQLSGSPYPIRALAVIVRAADQPRDGRYSAGVRFLGINKADVAKIERFVALQKQAEQAKKPL